MERRIKDGAKMIIGHATKIFSIKHLYFYKTIKWLTNQINAGDWHENVMMEVWDYVCIHMETKDGMEKRHTFEENKGLNIFNKRSEGFRFNIVSLKGILEPVKYNPRLTFYLIDNSGRQDMMILTDGLFCLQQGNDIQHTKGDDNE